MKVNARTDKFQHLEVFDKPALFTNGRIARDTVPEGWYCYDIRGSDDDPGELCYMEENVVVNHAGSVLMPEKLAMPKSGRLDVRDELGFLDEGNMTLREFCEAHQLPCPAENMKFHIRPARPEEAGLFYTPHPEEDKRLGTVGHVRMDFGRSGNEFWHTWWPRGPEELNSPAFKAELQQVVDTLRESVLKNRFAMERFCYEHGGKISGGWTQNYGYIVETEHYRYCLRCNPSPGDYNGYLTAYDLDVQRKKHPAWKWAAWHELERSSCQRASRFLWQLRRFPLTCGRSCGSCVVYQHRTEKKNKNWRYKMKKLQIMAGMLSVLLLAGCGGAGASAKTTEGDPPQVASAAASGTTAAQNGNENPSEVVTQDEAERPGPVDAEPSGEKKTNSSAGEAKPAAEVPPVQVLPAETVPPETPPTGSAPSEPVTDEAAPQPEEKAFAMDYWLAYAKDYAVSIGLVLDPAATGTWDTPIRCSSKTEDVLAAYIRDDLTYYKDQEGCTAVWIWADQIGDGQYELFIGRG